MEGAIKFQCPSCGAQLRPKREAKAHADYLGTICGVCGHRVTNDDVMQEVRLVTIDRLKNALER
jgi:hypothetical protein